MIVEEPRLIKTDAEEQFAAGLTMQRSANGKNYKPFVANGYARNLRTEPPKLDIALALSERNVFRCRTTADFDSLNSVFQAAPNFREVNRGAHWAFSAGLAAYRRYVRFIEKNGEIEMPEMELISTDETKPGSSTTAVEPQTVNFEHPEFCSGCDPVTCIIEGNDFSGGNWRDVLVALTEAFLQSKPKAAELYRTSIYPNGERAFLLKDKPKLSARQLSNGYWIHVNLSIKDLVFAIGKLCEFCGVDLNDVDITYVPKQSARGIKPMIQIEDNSKLLDVDSAVDSESSVPDAVINVLIKTYASGFRFDTTYINLLSSASGVEVDERIQSTLKRIMYRRDDDVYFLLDIVADVATRKDIVKYADTYLQEYGCFEILEFYKLYQDAVNPNCIRNADDFESFYEQIGKSGVRCVQAPQIGNRIVRYSNDSVWKTFKEVAAKIVSVINEEYYGSCNEDDLHTKFCAFSTDLLGKIIKFCAADELICVEINGSVCYQTFDALGLPDNFSEVLAEVLEHLNDIGLDPMQDVLHTAISLRLGVNFKAEYNLPDWDTYRRLIAAFYKAEPRREWKYNIFGEVIN